MFQSNTFAPLKQGTKSFPKVPLKSAESGVLFSAFCGGRERIIRNEGRAGEN